MDPSSPSPAAIQPPSPPPSSHPWPPPPIDLANMPPPPPFKRTRIKYRLPYMDGGKVEDVSRYVPGGYHPVNIGARINEFTVLHKLGSGGFATVWLVQSAGDSRYYALKIFCSNVRDEAVNERRILERLGAHGKANVIELLGSFDIAGPNGLHTCLVLPVCGPSLDSWGWAAGRTFTPAAKYRIAEQIVSGVAFLHERGVAHADLTPSNVVFSLPHIQSMSPEAVCRLLGPIKTEKLKLVDGSYSQHGPRKIVRNPSFEGFNISMTSAAVTILDFGEAFSLAQPRPVHRSGLGVPIHLTPPEVCFGFPPSAGSDVWGLACLLFETFCGGQLFPELFLTCEQLLVLITQLAGALPLGWKGRFDVENYGYWEDNQLRSTPDGWPSWFVEMPAENRTTVRELITQASRQRSVASGGSTRGSSPQESLTVEQVDFLASLLRDMLVVEPGQRLSSRESMLRLQAASRLFAGEVAERMEEERPYVPDPDDPPPSPPPDSYDDSESE